MGIPPAERIKLGSKRCLEVNSIMTQWEGLFRWGAGHPLVRNRGVGMKEPEMPQKKMRSITIFFI
jgi:hypothetical protein